MSRLADQVVLVTGGGRGIGRSIALALAREGAKVAITSRTLSELQKVVREAKAMGAPDALAIVADAMSGQDQRAAVRQAIEHFGHIDVLINNAGGVYAPNGVKDLNAFSHDDDVFIKNMHLNVTSAYWATSEALPHMRERNYGRVIFIGSGYSKRSGGFIVYTAAKHALVGLTRSLAAEAAPFGIAVNCLCPGWTNTSLVDFDALAQAVGSDAATVKRALESDSLQKRILEPDELGPMAVLLASRESTAITGQMICVDGGYKV